MVAFDAEGGPRRVDSACLLDMVRSLPVGVGLEVNPQTGQAKGPREAETLSKRLS